MAGASAAPLRVLYSFPDTLGAPGIGTTAWNQAAGLIGLGHEVRVYATARRAAGPGGDRDRHDAHRRRQADAAPRGRPAAGLPPPRPPGRPMPSALERPGSTSSTAGRAPRWRRPRRRAETGVVSVREAPEHAHRLRVRACRRRDGAARASPAGGHSHTVDDERRSPSRSASTRPSTSSPSPPSSRAARSSTAGFPPSGSGCTSTASTPTASRRRPRAATAGRRGCGRSSSAAASRARASTTRSRPGSDSGAAERGTLHDLRRLLPRLRRPARRVARPPERDRQGASSPTSRPSCARATSSSSPPSRRGARSSPTRRRRPAACPSSPTPPARAARTSRTRSSTRPATSPALTGAPRAPRPRPRPARAPPRPHARPPGRAHLGAGRARPRRPLPGAAGAMKVMIVGLDCAEPSLLLERWRDELPVLSSLMEKGATAA